MPRRYQPKGLHTANMPVSDQEIRAAMVTPPRSFITIAQQAGAECFSLPQRLAEALNKRDPSLPAWSPWDQELIEKVSSETQIPAELVASLGTSGHSWIDDLLSDISGRTDEAIIFGHLKATVRTLAGSGHAILIGHGSTYMTRDLPRGLHIRLIAPTNYRIKNLTDRLHLYSREAVRHLRRHDRRRRAFLARFGLARPLASENFAAVLNVAELDEPRLIQAIVAMLPENGGAGA